MPQEAVCRWCTCCAAVSIQRQRPMELDVRVVVGRSERPVQPDRRHALGHIPAEVLELLLGAVCYACTEDVLKVPLGVVAPAQQQVWVVGASRHTEMGQCQKTRSRGGHAITAAAGCAPEARPWWVHGELTWGRMEQGRLPHRRKTGSRRCSQMRFRVQRRKSTPYHRALHRAGWAGPFLAVSATPGCELVAEGGLGRCWSSPWDTCFPSAA